MRAILTYHSIDGSGSPISCTPEAFERHLTWMSSGRVTVTTLEGLIKSPPDCDAVAVTFDDAFTNFADVAVPRLSERGIPVTLFVVTGRTGETNRWDDDASQWTPRLPLLDWPALVRIRHQGVSIGAHSRTHADLTAIDSDQLREEVAGSADDLEREMGVRPTAFAYPFGRVNAFVSKAVGEVFPFACTAELRTLDDHVAPTLLPRLDMYYFREAGQLEGWGTPTFGAYIGIRRGLRTLRTALVKNGHSLC
jgi:peptidoglycan/xylan/chitin deacetylase (PgdA/CDA1 family)